jgi:hypothetical protein
MRITIPQTTPYYRERKGGAQTERVTARVVERKKWWRATSVQYLVGVPRHHEFSAVA